MWPSLGAMPKDAEDDAGVSARRRRSDEEYLAHIEQLAHAVADEAFEEGWLDHGSDRSGRTPLQRSIIELAENLRHVHYAGDGCLDEEE